jgi:hypothetical protein
MVFAPSGPARREVTFDSGTTPKRAIAASADGTRFVLVYDDGRIELRDTASGEMVTEFKRNVSSLAFDDSQSFPPQLMIALDRGGTRVAYQGADRRIEVVDDNGHRSEPITLSPSPERRNLQAIDLSDDGRELVVSTQAGEAIWYDLEGVDAASIAPAGTGFDAQFVSKGRVAVVGKDGAQVIDLRSRQTKRYAVGGDSRRIAVDSTGRLLATVDGAGALQLWNADPVVALGESIEIRNISSVVPIRFTADGHYLLIGGTAEATWVDVWTADWPEVACSLVTDPLSSADIARYLGSSEKAESCP